MYQQWWFVLYSLGFPNRMRGWRNEQHDERRKKGMASLVCIGIGTHHAHRDRRRVLDDFRLTLGFASEQLKWQSTIHIDRLLRAAVCHGNPQSTRYTTDCWAATAAAMTIHDPQYRHMMVILILFILCEKLFWRGSVTNCFVRRDGTATNRHEYYCQGEERKNEWKCDRTNESVTKTYATIDINHWFGFRTSTNYAARTNEKKCDTKWCRCKTDVTIDLAKFSGIHILYSQQGYDSTATTNKKTFEPRSYMRAL
jgi:hypothetical protein